MYYAYKVSKVMRLEIRIQSKKIKVGIRSQKQKEAEF